MLRFHTQWLKVRSAALCSPGPTLTHSPLRHLLLPPCNKLMLSLGSPSHILILHIADSDLASRAPDYNLKVIDNRCSKFYFVAPMASHRKPQTVHRAQYCLQVFPSLSPSSIHLLSFFFPLPLRVKDFTGSGSHQQYQRYSCDSFR